MESLGQETVSIPAKGRRHTGPPGCLGDMHNIESELVQRNREIAQVRDQLGQRGVENSTWKGRHGELVGKLTDLEAERSKLRNQVRELCNRLETNRDQERALRARAERAEAELLKQEAEVKVHLETLETERTSAAKHAADLAGQIADERSARLAAEARLESLCAQRNSPPRPKQRPESLPELRLELASVAPEQTEHQEQGVVSDERSEADGLTRQLPDAACWLTLAASDSALLALLATTIAGSSTGAAARLTKPLSAEGLLENAIEALDSVRASHRSANVGGGAAAVAGTAPLPLDEAELRVQLTRSQVEVETLRRRTEGLAMAAEDALAYRNQGLEVATDALAREALMAAQLEETRRARSVELRALVKRMSKPEVAQTNDLRKQGSTANSATPARVRPAVSPLPLAHGCATGGA